MSSSGAPKAITSRSRWCLLQPFSIRNPSVIPGILASPSVLSVTLLPPSSSPPVTTKELKQLTDELRSDVIFNVSKTGGHLGSSLGVVELTVALHYVFNVPQDKILWEVGHQSYLHKILTGRRDKMHTMRQTNGLARFTKLSESEYDCFCTGHSSTTISAGLGVAKFDPATGKQFKVGAKTQSYTT